MHNPEELSQKTDDFLNKFIQEREYQIILHNDLNLHSINGLDLLKMILQFSNNDFDFQPLVKSTYEVLFENNQLNDWFVEQFV